MTAKRTSPGKAAAEAAEAEPGPELDLPEEAAAPEPDDDDARPEPTLEVAFDAEDPAPDDAPEADPAAEADAEEALDAAAEALDPEDAPDADDALDAAGDDAPPAEAAEDVAPSGPAAGEPIRLHRRARHDETEELLAWLLAAPAGAPLTLDASEVDNVSTPYVLAIVAAARARADAGSPAVVTSPSPAFVDAFSDLGLFGDLMKMEIRA